MESSITITETNGIGPGTHAGDVPMPWSLTAGRIDLFSLEDKAQKIALPGETHPFEVNETSKGPRLDTEPSGTSSDNGATQDNQALAAGLPELQVTSRVGHEDHPVFLIIDQRMTMLFGSRPRTKSFVAAQTAALIAWRAAVGQGALGAVIFNDQAIEELCPRCSRLRVRLILNLMITQNHAAWPFTLQRLDLGMLNEALRRTALSSLTGARIFLITDGSGWNNHTSALISHLCKENSVFAMLVHDRRTLEYHKLQQQFEVRGGQPEAPAQMALPPEASVVLLNTRASVVSQLKRTWGSPKTVEPLHEGHPLVSSSFAEQADCETGVLNGLIPDPQKLALENLGQRIACQ